jgi:hypothetical protein
MWRKEGRKDGMLSKQGRCCTVRPRRSSEARRVKDKTEAHERTCGSGQAQNHGGESAGVLTTGLGKNDGCGGEPASRA